VTERGGTGCAGRAPSYFKGMVNEVRILSERSAEMTVPNGCPSCGGPVAIRVSGSSAWSICLACRTLSQARVARQPDGLLVDFTGGAQA
jgi:hypothetical protein